MIDSTRVIFAGLLGSLSVGISVIVGYYAANKRFKSAAFWVVSFLVYLAFWGVRSFIFPPYQPAPHYAPQMKQPAIQPVALGTESESTESTPFLEQYRQRAASSDRVEQYRKELNDHLKKYEHLAPKAENSVNTGLTFAQAIGMSDKDFKSLIEKEYQSCLRNLERNRAALDPSFANSLTMEAYCSCVINTAYTNLSESEILDLSIYLTKGRHDGEKGPKALYEFFKMQDRCYNEVTEEEVNAWRRLE